MQKRIYKMLLLAILSLAFNSCSNDDDNIESLSLSGNYNGIFTVEYLNGDKFSNPVTVKFSSNNNYHSSGNGNKNDFYPAGGNGTYEMNNSKIIFSDSNIWLAHFDWNLILAGEYEYSKSGNELIISAYRSKFGLYRYELIKEQ
ncbi:hypothetical protein [Galbibacter mesophilus]|uniref:hypothetical protein n=1 Tax=Galbibacter mesophilus TaxID=379069 RepID=UPI00191DA579|nr:hypothetical protein [Galbibacter mesophilus]MCM5662953.1 hypothetical protein [Galbibacter mesophilus]